MPTTARALLTPAMVGLGLALLLGQALAFQVRPVRIDLSPRQTATQLVVSNPGPHPLLVQAEAFDWTQDQTRDQLSPSQSLILNPPIFELAPGAQQVLRVGLRRAAEPGVERAHRVWLTQVPTPGAGTDSGVQMLLRVSLPVFVLGTGTGAPRPMWRRDPASGAVALDNPGGQHLHVRELRLQPEAGETVTLGPCYALPGGQCRWEVPAALRAPTVQLQADTDAGPLQTRLDAPAPR